MSRFGNEHSEDPTTAAQPETQDAELAQPERQKWYHWHRDSDGAKEKKGSADEIDYVEEVDGVWGKLGDGKPNYKTVGW
jgi:hypothetical protein